MKRIVSIILISALLLSLSGCYADSFSIRNGITMGMDVDEVERIEAQNGLSGGVNNRDQYPDNPIASLKYIGRELLGLDGVMLKYYFQKDTNEIFCIQYSGYYKERRDDTFDSLKSLLVDKYGLSECNTENKKLPLYISDDFSAAIDAYDFNADPVHGAKANLLRWEDWLIEYDSYYVDMSLYYRYCKDTFSIERSEFELQYTYHTKEEVNNKLLQNSEEKKKLMDSI